MISEEDYQDEITKIAIRNQIKIPGFVTQTYDELKRHDLKHLVLAVVTTNQASENDVPNETLSVHCLNGQCDNRSDMYRYQTCTFRFLVRFHAMGSRPR